MTFSAILKAIKKQYPIENDHLAEHLHTDEETIEKWEKGEAYPSHHQLEHFSEIFALPMSILEDSINH